jgi:hypothetical protein
MAGPASALLSYPGWGNTSSKELSLISSPPQEEVMSISIAAFHTQ